MGFDGLTNLLPAVALPDLSDAAFAGAWDAVVSTAASKDSLYNKLEALPALVASSTGSYTPATSNTANISSVTMNSANYLQVGSLVFVFGTCAPSSTAAGVSGWNVSLPIASAMTLVGQLNGALSAYSKQLAGGIQGDIARANARMSYNQNASGATGGMSYFYIYQVV